MRVSIAAIFDAFDGPLSLIDDEQERKRIARVLEAGRPAVENAVYRMFAEAVRGVNESLDGSRLDVRLVDDGVDIEVIEEAEPSTLESDFSISPGDVEKLTLRIIEPLKKAAAEAAAEEGRSLNNWISSALARHLERRQRQGRHEMRRAAREMRRAARGMAGHDDDDIVD
ncbi:MAG: toxin-antitoxin system HicB family antitoxin [Chloroflexi bacterium]|nr:toxin-antitoxin system HicB family antitoxin [Chloroflexota bacterium]MDA1146203.1 toxin-antitoxin system HicB family antitoxin [Chloroflexota bacterium]